MNILVIGGSGFIGRATVACLLAAGHAVTVLHRGRQPAPLPAAVRTLIADRDALPAQRGVLRRLRPDVVIDAYAMTAQHARDLVEVFDGHAGRLLLIGSADVYRNYDGLRRRSEHRPDPPPLAEDAPLRERLYPYRGQAGIAVPYRDDYDKIPVERTAAGAADLPLTLLRLPLVYGPGDHQRLLWPYLQRMRDGRPRILLGARQALWRFTRGYIENVAAAVALAATDARAASGTYNLGEARTPTEIERIRALGAAAGWTGEPCSVPEPALPPPLRLPLNFDYSLWTDTARLRRELGFCEPVDETTALTRTVEWELAHPLPGPPIDYAAEDAALADAGG
ncbi:MAG: NAD-dependent epimerase/dehydratase family protein [Gammaproteobacteria bacterium]|nr:NAD-dependent epimerase/dehydratase family protein [Gammaproteobacteria bacterium]